MHRSFKALAVRDEEDLRDPLRVRKLFLLYYRGTLAMAARCVALGLAGTVLVAGIWLEFPAGLERTTTAIIVALLCFCCVGLGAILFRETATSPLCRYWRFPGEYAFARARLTKAYYRQEQSSSSRRARVSGDFPGGGIIIPVEFQAALWSNSVAEAGEEALTPADDRHPQKGKRLRLPLEAFVLYRRDKPRLGELAGFPADVAERLEAAANRARR